jgi:hypothetical protein
MQRSAQLDRKLRRPIRSKKKIKATDPIQIRSKKNSDVPTSGYMYLLYNLALYYISYIRSVSIINIDV